MAEGYDEPFYDEEDDDARCAVCGMELTDDEQDVCAECELHAR